MASKELLRTWQHTSGQQKPAMTRFLKPILSGGGSVAASAPLSGNGCRLMIRVFILVLSAVLSERLAWCQFGGTRAGVESRAGEISGPPMLDPEVVKCFIAIDGRAEVRVRPSEIRIVFAVTSDGRTAGECHAAIADTIGKLKSSWSGMGLPGENIVEDFIAVLPLYEWKIEGDVNEEIGVEERSGFRMQTNIHLAVPNDANAAKAFEMAIQHGVTDIIAFDYWSKELDETKIKAREQAVKAARSKSDRLFASLFDSAPPVINVQEQTDIYYPETLYHSLVNTYDEEVTRAWRRDIPFIRAHRPRNTYYRGLYSDSDVQARELPMHPEISVVSSVRLYFESPAANRAKQDGNEHNE